jgi:hypothetical protein
MEPSRILDVLLDLAREADLEVRPVGRGGLEAGESQAASGVVKLKGRVWVMLSSVDPVAIQLEVLAGALRDHAAEWIEQKHLPPAIRDLLDPSPGS